MARLRLLPAHFVTCRWRPKGSGWAPNRDIARCGESQVDNMSARPSPDGTRLLRAKGRCYRQVASGGCGGCVRDHDHHRNPRLRLGLAYVLRLGRLGSGRMMLDLLRARRAWFLHEVREALLPHCATYQGWMSSPKRRVRAAHLEKLGWWRASQWHVYLTCIDS
jgi:hypothetical protein